MTTESHTTHELKTREIYQKQHERLATDDAAIARIKGIYDDETFGVDPTWYEGKEALDIGCGNVGALIAKLTELKVKKSYGIDIATDWMDSLTASLEGQNIGKEKYELSTGNHLSIPFEDNRFDMVFSNGILIHLPTLEDIKAGFKEASRVCKKDGYFFASFGPCQGLVQGAIFPAIRKYYRENKEFAAFIDNINPETIHESIDKITKDAKKFADQDFDQQWMKSLFGVDFCVFLQNYIQAPSWLSNECTPEFVEKMFEENGYKNVKRLSHFCKRTDVRKYFAPLHFDMEHPMSKVLYGEGYVQYVGQKI
ncbi:hypothetical protein A9Q84_05280 [Halobacteriovorax marinus]|uniref:Methyltransferase type 11 domain-containing protein n=1 Tax=Halobacteriovorax marinus TaxID=97084 RepID=A0A1Y5FB47_9BACT|nr:hypothetical protein A9Q84_05280 [Halobacteriovorax marinus]